MRLIEVHLIERVFTAGQMHQMIDKLTDAMVSNLGENLRGMTWVKVVEWPAANGASAASLRRLRLSAR